VTGAAAAELRTARLVLRQWRDDDLGPFAALNADPEVMRYLPGILDRPQSDALALRFQNSVATGQVPMWAAEVSDEAAFIGYVGLAPATFPASFTPAVEIGWRLARAYWNRGYATEAARAVLRYAFDVLRLPEVVSFTAVINLPSRRVMEKLGMQRRDDFDHPRVPDGSPLRRHVLYRIGPGE
jgi:RimJ/RimL family protein N-acetyltransferase